MSARQLRLYSTPPHDCSYLEDHTAVNAVLDPDISLSNSIYSQLIDHGFRRSGGHLYAPHCPNCSACQASRVPVAEFNANRSQRRCIKSNADLSVKVQEARYSDEYYDLYTRYLDSRHPEGGMSDTTPEKFKDFLIADWCSTRFIEFRKDNRLVSVSVTDLVSQGYSAVYTFFDPEESRRSLGTLAPLWLIRQAARSNLPWVYLGYYIANCSKMNYKSNYKPLHLLKDGQWQSINT